VQHRIPILSLRTLAAAKIKILAGAERVLADFIVDYFVVDG
jgi:hypothetical protein